MKWRKASVYPSSRALGRGLPLMSKKLPAFGSVYGIGCLLYKPDSSGCPEQIGLAWDGPDIRSPAVSEFALPPRGKAIFIRVWHASVNIIHEAMRPSEQGKMPFMHVAGCDLELHPATVYLQQQ
ncbi:hypothetical protein AUEXF2481DRAFT_39056 [Aureobasidium subglaciale EXF-2481]|uniref:Uncharacterized protein n=1 Tax=Aureobasidium subglaciale (strain EXF-2481) TaxID=1043005 RepID=A0A074YDT7_AURSE|nr:uncharacterized protein AUEXF2481DRAFT_39056 [Aureobasidium subglaciale EXF-2481]KEQ95978.1 hypothetical protein AUEXF2481DRAFT_39056 [Aureobasidium subglaciale EXF-2481]